MPVTHRVSETVHGKRKRENLRLKTSYDRIKKGQAFDIIDLLSTKYRDFLVSSKDGRRFPISSLNNMYVLVYCFTFPSDKNHLEVVYWQALEALYSQHPSPLKLVIILNFEDEDEDAFDAFFHKLSLDCLTVPFSDSKSRRLIADSLTSPSSPGHSVLALGPPNGLVLQHSSSHYLVKYGAQSFPFTDSHFAAINKQTNDLRLQFTSSCSRLTLESLLQCDSLSPIGNEDESVSTFSLKGKTVGLYLYFNGLDMVRLHDIYKQCLENHNEFQIVLVPLPFVSLDPDSFSNQMKQSALKLGSSTSSWLAFPFNDKICRTLWRITYSLFRDELLIMPCGDRPGEVDAKYIVRKYGINAYPFTRDAIANKKVEQLRSQTLESLLGDADSNFCQSGLSFA